MFYQLSKKASLSSFYAQVGDMNKDIRLPFLGGAFWSHITQPFFEESLPAMASEEGFSPTLPPGRESTSFHRCSLISACSFLCTCRSRNIAQTLLGTVQQASAFSHPPGAWRIPSKTVSPVIWLNWKPHSWRPPVRGQCHLEWQEFYHLVLPPGYILQKWQQEKESLHPPQPQKNIYLPLADM